VSLRCAPGRAARAVGNDTTVANGAEPPAHRDNDTAVVPPLRGLGPAGAHPSRNGNGPVRRVRARPSPPGPLSRTRPVGTLGCRPCTGEGENTCGSRSRHRHPPRRMKPRLQRHEVRLRGLHGCDRVGWGSRFSGQAVEDGRRGSVYPTAPARAGPVGEGRHHGFIAANSFAGAGGPLPRSDPHPTAPLSHFRTSALPHFRTSALPHFRTSALSHFRTSVSPPPPPAPAPRRGRGWNRTATRPASRGAGARRSGSRRRACSPRRCGLGARG